MVNREPAEESGEKPKCFGEFDDGEVECDRCHNDVAAACRDKTHEAMIKRVEKSAKKAPKSEPKKAATKSEPRKKRAKKPAKKAPKKKGRK